MPRRVLRQCLRFALYLNVATQVSPIRSPRGRCPFVGYIVSTLLGEAVSVAGGWLSEKPVLT